MARRRFQDPRPSRRGQYWWLLIRQDEIVDGQRIRKRKRVKLAPADMPEREVRKIAAETLRPLNQGLVTIGSAPRFDDYVEQEYKMTVLPTFAGQTQQRYSGIVRNYLSPEFGQLALRELTPLRIQKYFAGVAKFATKPRVQGQSTRCAQQHPWFGKGVRINHHQSR